MYICGRVVIYALFKQFAVWQFPVLLRPPKKTKVQTKMVYKRFLFVPGDFLRFRQKRDYKSRPTNFKFLVFLGGSHSSVDCKWNLLLPSFLPQGKAKTRSFRCRTSCCHWRKNRVLVCLERIPCTIIPVLRSKLLCFSHVRTQARKNAQTQTWRRTWAWTQTDTGTDAYVTLLHARHAIHAECVLLL